MQGRRWITAARAGTDEWRMAQPETMLAPLRTISTYGAVSQSSPSTPLAFPVAPPSPSAPAPAPAPAPAQAPAVGGGSGTLAAMSRKLLTLSSTATKQYTSLAQRVGPAHNTHTRAAADRPGHQAFTVLSRCRCGLQLRPQREAVPNLEGCVTNSQSFTRTLPSSHWPLGSGICGGGTAKAPGLHRSLLRLRRCRYGAVSAVTSAHRHADAFL